MIIFLDFEGFHNWSFDESYLFSLEEYVRFLLSDFKIRRVDFKTRYPDECIYASRIVVYTPSDVRGTTVEW